MVETIGTGPKDRKRRPRKENSMRIYGKILHTWTHTDEQGRLRTSQMEVEYRDWNEAGQLIGTGSEDFSPERWKQTIRSTYVWAWDGHSFNRGGHRAFEYQTHITYRRQEAKAVKAFYKALYKAEAIELR